MIYFVRLLDFVLHKLLWVAVVAALVLYTLYFSINASNLYILAKEGLYARDQAVMTREGMEELGKYFTTDWMAKDEKLLLDGRYWNYTIRSFNHQMSLKGLVLWPWGKTAEMEVTENVSWIDGELPEELKSEAQRAAGGKIVPPAWQNASMKLSFVKTDSGWKISNISELALSPTPTPLPSAAASPLPMITPSPTPSPTPQVSSYTLVVGGTK